MRSARVIGHGAKSRQELSAENWEEFQAEYLGERGAASGPSLSGLEAARVALSFADGAGAFSNGKMTCAVSTTGLSGLSAELDSRQR